MRGRIGESAQRADLVHARQGTPEDLPRLGRIELGGAPAHPGKRWRSETRGTWKSVCPPITSGAATGSSAAASSPGVNWMLLGDLRIAPARRPVELEHPLFSSMGAELVDAVLVAVEGKEAPVGLQPDRCRRRSSSTTSGVRA